MADKHESLQATENALVLRADLPGIEPDEVKLRVEEGVLTVSGEHEESSEEEREGYSRRERRFASFSHSVSVPPDTKADDVEVKAEDGVVQVTIPRAAPA